MFLEQLEAQKREFSRAAGKTTVRLIRALARGRFSEPARLVRFHEALLFHRAYPATPEVALAADEALLGIAAKVEQLEDAEALSEPDVSGIAGSEVSAVFSRAVARDLVRRHGGALSIYWEAWEHPERLGLVLPQALPLAADDAWVEADVPYREWLEAAGGLPWLVEHADNYDALEVPLRWQFGDSAATRTRMRLPCADLFCHAEPLIPRKAVSLDEIPSAAPLPVRRLSRREGERILELARDTSAVRYRELWGFTHGDPQYVREVQAGRGVVFYLWGLPPESRLPLRTYHAATIWKNGVPLGYFEGLALADRMEAGFNLYYTFREGETAWLYARLLRMFHQMTGVTCFWLDPYQIGHENEEAIQSGAFWFYRKLGYWSTDPELRSLTEQEERRIARDPHYRTPARLLRRMVRAPMVYGFPGSRAEDWCGFETRRIGMEVVRQLRDRFGGDRAKMERAGRRVLPEASADWACLAAALPGAARWTSSERKRWREIAATKTAAEETGHLRLMQQHARLREALLGLGR